MIDFRGKSPRQVWEETTGLEWSDARERGLTDGSAEQNLSLMRRLMEEGDFVTQDIEPVQLYALANEKVKGYQKENFIDKGVNPDENYAIVDKDINKMYLFNPNHKLIGAEPVVTGADTGDAFVAPSMNGYLRSDLAEDLNNDGNLNAKDYFQYLEQNKQRVTPNGVYYVDNYRDDVLNPRGKKARLLSFFSKDYEDKIKNARSKSYGDGRMLTLTDKYNRGQSFAVHTTGDSLRNARIDKGEGDRRMSNGCINVGGRSMCFDNLREGSQLHVIGGLKTLQDT